MPEIDSNTLSSLVNTALDAAKGVAGSKWSAVSSFAANEFFKLAQDAALLAKMVELGKLTEEQAALHIDLQKQAARSVFLAVEGIGLVLAEQIINAAMDALRAPLNNLIGFSLL